MPEYVGYAKKTASKLPPEKPGKITKPVKTPSKAKKKKKA
jgi:hypothetical protein